MMMSMTTSKSTTKMSHLVILDDYVLPVRNIHLISSFLSCPSASALILLIDRRLAASRDRVPAVAAAAAPDRPPLTVIRLIALARSAAALFSFSLFPSLFSNDFIEFGISRILRLF